MDAGPFSFLVGWKYEAFMNANVAPISAGLVIKLWFVWTNKISMLCLQVVLLPEKKKE